jgi:hypothetical protein
MVEASPGQANVELRYFAVCRTCAEVYPRGRGCPACDGDAQAAAEIAAAAVAVAGATETPAPSRAAPRPPAPGPGSRLAVPMAAALGLVAGGLLLMVLSGV